MLTLCFAEPFSKCRRTFACFLLVWYHYHRKKGCAKFMARKNPYTDEQIQKLSQNPYTHAVSPHRVSFTIEFKKFFTEQANIPGMTTKKIFLAAGYDLDCFSKESLDSIRRTILTEANSPEGFKAGRGLSHAEKAAQFAAKDLAKQSTDASIKEMQERIVHLEQQINFLKKISHIREMAEKDNPT